MPTSSSLNLGADDDNDEDDDDVAGDDEDTERVSASGLCTDSQLGLPSAGAAGGGTAHSTEEGAGSKRLATRASLRVREARGKDTLYCVCRGTDDGRPMIGCDGPCKDWFHMVCLGLSPTLPTEDAPYVCPACRVAGGGLTDGSSASAASPAQPPHTPVGAENHEAWARLVSVGAEPGAFPLSSSQLAALGAAAAVPAEQAGTHDNGAQPSSRADLELVFKKEVLDEYGECIARGVADVAAEQIRSVLPELRKAPHAGIYNRLAASLLWVEDFAALDGALYCLLALMVRFLLLCDFHIYQAVRRAIHNRSYLPPKAKKVAGPLLLAHFKRLVNGVLTWPEFVRVTTPILHDACGRRLKDGGFAFHAYVRKCWFSPKWWPLVCHQLRLLVPHLLTDTTNGNETTHNELKQLMIDFLLSKNLRCLLQFLTGVPLPGLFEQQYGASFICARLLREQQVAIFLALLFDATCALHLTPSIPACGIRRYSTELSVAFKGTG